MRKEGEEVQEEGEGGRKPRREEGEEGRKDGRTEGR
jgi:hypothetical protein